MWKRQPLHTNTWILTLGSSAQTALAWLSATGGISALCQSPGTRLQRCWGHWPLSPRTQHPQLTHRTTWWWPDLLDSRVWLAQDKTQGSPKCCPWELHKFGGAKLSPLPHASCSAPEETRGRHLKKPEERGKQRPCWCKEAVRGE